MADDLLRASILAYLTECEPDVATTLRARWAVPGDVAPVNLRDLVPPASRPAAFSADREAKFAQYCRTLSERGYFKGVDEGTPAYEERVRKARAAFAKKFPTEAAEEGEGLSAEEKRKRADAHKEAGNALLAAKDYTGAVSEYSAALRIAPHAIYYSNRAAALQLLSRHSDAVKDCRAAIALDPDYVKAHVRLVQALRSLGQHDEAQSALSQALVLHPDSPSLAALQQRGGAPAMPDMTRIAEMFGRGGPGAEGMGADGMGAGGVPSFAEMMANPGFVQMAQNLVQQNPELMRAAEQMMQNPEMLQQMFANMPGGMGGMGGMDGVGGVGGVPPTGEQ